ncbi:MAG: PP0621 family protein [Pseudomonadota bacterium]
MRYVILLALILVAVLFYRWRRARGLPKAEREAGASPPGAAPGQPVRTVRCAECGLVLPEKEAVRLNGQVFCSAQHARRWQERHPR